MIDGLLTLLNVRGLGLLLLALMAVQAAHAREIQSLESIGAVVRGYLEVRNAHLQRPPQIDVGRMDPRLRLPLCAEPLEAYQPAGYRSVGNTTVGVRCRGDKPWSLFVQASVKVFEVVWVARRSMGRGNELSEADIEQAEREVGRLASGYVVDKSDLIGMILKRPVRQGDILAENMLSLPRWIKRGDKVTISATGKGLSVRMEGKALAHGAKGERIRVRNLSSQREIEAVVVAPGQVQVNM